MSPAPGVGLPTTVSLPVASTVYATHVPWPPPWASSVRPSADQAVGVIVPQLGGVFAQPGGVRRFPRSGNASVAGWHLVNTSFWALRSSSVPFERAQQVLPDRGPNPTGLALNE